MRYISLLLLYEQHFATLLFFILLYISLSALAFHDIYISSCGRVLQGRVDTWWV